MDGEQQNTHAVGLRWPETFVCYMHRSRLEICILRCNVAPRTVDPQDWRMEHQRATETRETSLLLENSAGKILRLERL